VLLTNNQTGILSPEKLRTVKLDWGSNFPNEDQRISQESRTSSCLVIWDLSPNKPRSYYVDISEGQTAYLGQDPMRMSKSDSSPIDLYEIDPARRIPPSSLRVSHPKGSLNLVVSGSEIHVRLHRKWKWCKPQCTTQIIVRPAEHLFGLIGPWFSFVVFGVDK